MAHQMELIKNELALISLELDIAKSDWTPPSFIFSLVDYSDYLNHLKTLNGGTPFLDVTFPPT